MKLVEKYWFLLIVVISFLTSCTCSEKAVVATIGKQQITKQYVLYRDQVEKIYDGSEQRKTGLYRLSKNYQSSFITKSARPTR
jgi:hypothetical protein